MLRLSSVAALVALVLAACSTPALSTPHYSSFYNETFSWNVAKSPTVAPLTVTSGAGGKLTIANTAFGGSPFNSVFNVNVTVDAVKNLAFPFTGPSGTYQDVDTGIDVVAGGTVSFFIPAGATGGQWCFELGRAGAGNQYCSGPAGAFYSGSDPTLPAYLYNAKINGAYPSSDPAVPNYIEVQNTSLGLNSHVGFNEPSNTPFNLTQHGTNRGFTWTRSGSIVFRIGAYPRAGQADVLSYNFEDPTTDYDSALDSTAENNHPPPTIPATTGWKGRNIVTPISGRLFLACWRWNLWPALNYGQTSIMINYTSPVQLAASWSPSFANTSYASYAQPTIIANQSLPGAITLPDTFASSFAATSLNATLRAFLPVENITVNNFQPGKSAVAPLLQSSFSYHYPNQAMRPVQAVLNGPVLTTCCYGGQSGYYQWDKGVIQQFDGLFATLVGYNGQLAWDMTHILDGNSSSPYFASSGTFAVNTINNAWYPQSRGGSYFADVDTGLNALEGGTITLSAPIAQWCMASYNNNASQLCSDARGVPSFSYFTTQQTSLIGCDNFYWIFPNSTVYNQSDYDNSGCNSGSISEPPNGALLLRVGSNNQGHSPIDYATAFTDRTQTGTLTATYRVPASGRIYLSAAVMFNPNVLTWTGPTPGVVTQNTIYTSAATNGNVYQGQQTVTVTYTPPAETSFGFTWSPQITSTASLPYAASAPASLAVADLTAAGFTLVPATSGTGLGAGVTTGQYIYKVLPEAYTAGALTVYSSTMYAYLDLAESDYTATTSSGSTPVGPSASSSSTGTVAPSPSSAPNTPVGSSSAAAPTTSTGGGNAPSNTSGASAASCESALLVALVMAAMCLLMA